MFFLDFPAPWRAIPAAACRIAIDSGSSSEDQRIRRALRPLVFVLLTAAPLTLLGGCSRDLGPCDEADAKTLFYTDTGLPAYGGQALIQRSCGGGAFCHTEYDGNHYGAPAGLEMDLQLVSTAEQTEVLRRGVQHVQAYRALILDSVERGLMPPGAVGAYVESQGPSYLGLPTIDSTEGRQMLENWLACNAPVVERTNARPAGIVAVGDIVSSISCGAGLSICSNACVDTQSDPVNCGSCDSACSGATPYCSAGSCVPTCPPMTTNCSGGCVDTSSDALHCGGCNSPCTTDRVCSAGTCVCAATLTECGTSCVDTQTDKANCGGCAIPCGATENCEGGMCVACGTNTSFAADVQPVFTNRCVICHDGAGAAAGLDLSAGNALANLVGVTSWATLCKSSVLVQAGDPAGSYLLDKLQGAADICGQSMPLNGAMLPASELATIEDWICGGALNN